MELSRAERGRACVREATASSGLTSAAPLTLFTQTLYTLFIL